MLQPPVVPSLSMNPGNIQHPASNAQHSLIARMADIGCSMLDVGGWMFSFFQAIPDSVARRMEVSCPAAPLVWLWCGFGMAFGWLSVGFGWLWYGFGVALCGFGWLCSAPFAPTKLSCILPGFVASSSVFSSWAAQLHSHQPVARRPLRDTAGTRAPPHRRTQTQIGRA